MLVVDALEDGGLPEAVSGVALIEKEWMATRERFATFLPQLDKLDLSVTSSVIARAIGLANSKSLTIVLRTLRLPPFRTLRDWYYVVRMTEQFATTASLSSFALSRSKNPSEYYRLVRRVSGQPWNSIKVLGTCWAKEQALIHWSPWTRQIEASAGHDTAQRTIELLRIPHIVKGS